MILATFVYTMTNFWWTSSSAVMTHGIDDRWPAPSRREAHPVERSTCKADPRRWPQRNGRAVTNWSLANLYRDEWINDDVAPGWYTPKSDRRVVGHESPQICFITPLASFDRVHWIPSFSWLVVLNLFKTYFPKLLGWLVGWLLHIVRSTTNHHGFGIHGGAIGASELAIGAQKNNASLKHC